MRASVATTTALMRDRQVKAQLIMLLIKLDLYPRIVNNGELYPAPRWSREYRDWYGL